MLSSEFRNSSKCSNKENVMQNKLNDSFPSCLIHCCLAMHILSAASEPGTTTFCVRFNSPSTMLKSYSFNPLWTMNTTIFQETPNLYHILKPIVERRFQKIITGRSLRSSLISAFSFYYYYLQETLQHFARFWHLFLSVM